MLKPSVIQWISLYNDLNLKDEDNMSNILFFQPIFCLFIHTSLKLNVFHFLAAEQTYEAVGLRLVVLTILCVFCDLFQ